MESAETRPPARPAADQPTLPDPRPLTIREFARRYHVSEATVYYWGRRGLLKMSRFGPRTLRIRPEDEDRWLRERGQAEAEAEVSDLAKERTRMKAHARAVMARWRTRYRRRLEAQAERIEVRERVRAEREARTRMEAELKARLAREAEVTARLEAEAKALARVATEARLQAEVQARVRAQYRPPALTPTEIAARFDGPDGLHRLGLSRPLRHRLAGMGIYCVRDLTESPRHHLLTAVLDVKGLRELRTALAVHHGLALDDRGQLSPLVREEAA